MQWVLIVIGAIAGFGHLALWVAVFNRLHALAFPCAVVKLLEKLNVAACLLIPPALAWRLTAAGVFDAGPPSWRLAPLAAFYLALCAALAAMVIPTWIGRRFFPPKRSALLSNKTRIVDAVQLLDHRPAYGLTTRLAASIPGNQLFQLHVNHKLVQVARLPAALEGMTITHISDLHFTGGIGREFFDFVVDEANSLDSDLLALTGDVVDKARCLDWIPQVLGRLNSRHGAYFVLGNHDKRIQNTAALRKSLHDAGLVDLGDCWRHFTLQGAPLVLAGNELPWFGPAADMENCPQQFGGQRTFRVLLSHSPDQIHWARSYDFDLILAGHTHGGQIRLPLVGPLVSPSLYGVKYASGVFYEPPTVMHVSRGVSGLHPLRFNCPPEITQLELRQPAKGQAG